MESTPPDSDLPPSDAASAPVWKRGYNRYALGIVLLIHLALLVYVLLNNTVHIKSAKPESREVVMYLSKPPEKITPPPPPKPKVAPRPEAPPPKPVAPPPLPKLDFKPDAIKAPDAPPVAKLPTVDVAPGKGDTAAAAPPPPPPPPPAPPPAPPVAAKLFEECGESSDRHIVADVYQLRVNTQSVKEMTRRKPIKRVCLTQLDITPRSFLEGFPGLGSMTEWFGLDIRFTVNIAETTTRELMLLSDDGAILSIDDKEVIFNDGIHAASPETSIVTLDKGVHNFRVRYFQGPGAGLALMLAWKKPGAADFGYIPRSLLGRPPANTLAAITPKE